MRIAIYINSVLPCVRYGGTQRVAWSQARALRRLGNDVTLIAAKGTQADFARVVEIDPSMPVEKLVPGDVDIVHFHTPVDFSRLKVPYVLTVHGNDTRAGDIGPWSIFVSGNHAERHGAQAFVYNGLDWDDYPPYVPSERRRGLFFLGNAAWRVKNLKGGIFTAKIARRRLDVLGGGRLNFKMGFRLTLDPNVHFHGMVGNDVKAGVASASEGLVFPVKWHEPFGLAVVESLYYGTPVFATPYGSLPELVIPGTGALADNPYDLRDRILNGGFDSRLCHEYAADSFNSRIMAEKYLEYYEMRLNGEAINPELHTPDRLPSDYTGCCYRLK